MQISPLKYVKLFGSFCIEIWHNRSVVFLMKMSNIEINKAKQKALEAAISQIEKAHGKGSIMKLGQREKVAMETISTGSLNLDRALGIGGLPVGRIIEIYGPESSGKTTLAMHVIAEAQKAGDICAFVDAEHAFDPAYGKKIGMNIDELLISQPDTGEQALEIVDVLVRSGVTKVIVIDSVAALTPKAEIEGDMGDVHVGLQARLMSQALRKLAGIISKSNCVVIFINQIRYKIGVMFGSPETTTGGNALKFYASIRLDVRRIGSVKRGEDIVGNEVRVKVVKNKVAPPFRTAEFEITYGEGISYIGELIDVGSKLGVIDKSGSWYSFNGEKLGQGKESVKQALKGQKATVEKIRAAINNCSAAISDNENELNPIDLSDEAPLVSINDDILENECDDTRDTN
jgi:recombination protein RecA